MNAIILEFSSVLKFPTNVLQLLAPQRHLNPSINAFACNAKRFAIDIVFFFFSLFLALFLDELAKAFSQCLILRYPGLVWPVSGLFPWPHWQMFSFLFSLLLFQVWVASTCLICMWNVLGTIWHVLPDQRVCAWNTSLRCELCCCYYSSYN